MAESFDGGWEFWGLTGRLTLRIFLVFIKKWKGLQGLQFEHSRIVQYDSKLPQMRSPTIKVVNGNKDIDKNWQKLYESFFMYLHTCLVRAEIRLPNLFSRRTGWLNVRLGANCSNRI